MDQPPPGGRPGGDEEEQEHAPLRNKITKKKNKM
jgi:hypothetical protein